MPLRILIAEDEAIVAKGLALQLKGLGHSVVAIAENGAQAVMLARQLAPDLVLIDIKLPDMSGLEASRVILADRPLPIIVISGYSDEGLAKDASNSGVLAYLVKPVDENDLRPAIEVALSRFQELQALRQEVQDLKEALETRKLVERAKGIIMQRAKVPEGEAFHRLWQESRNQNRTLGEVARAVILAEKLL